MKLESKVLLDPEVCQDPWVSLVHTVHLGLLVSQGFKVLLVPQAPQALLAHLELTAVTFLTQSQRWREMDCLVQQDPEAQMDPLVCQEKEVLQEKEDLKERQVLWEFLGRMAHQDCQAHQDRGDNQEFMDFQGHLAAALQNLSSGTYAHQFCETS